MPFIAAAPALWGGIFAGSGALGAAALGRNSANKATKGLSQQDYNATRIAQEAAARQKPAYDAAYNYYRQMLEGDQSSLTPDITNAQLQFEQARKNMIQNAPVRSGGLNVALSNIEGAKALSISDIMSRGRPTAASALAALATGDQSAALQAFATAQQGKMGQQFLQQQALSGIGSFITRLLTTPGLMSMFGGGGGTRQPGVRYQYPETFFRSTGTNPWGNLPTGSGLGY